MEKEVYHFTTKEAAESINRTGLRSESYVTTQPMSKNSCPTKLEIPNQKCECVCNVRVHSTTELKTPKEGTHTSGGAPQFQTKQRIPPDKVSCRC